MSEVNKTAFDRLQEAREELAKIQDIVDRGKRLEAIIPRLEHNAGVDAQRVDEEFYELVVRPRDEKHQQAYAQEMMEYFFYGEK